MSEKSASVTPKFRLLLVTFCLIFICFHMHSGFARIFLTFFFRPLAVCDFWLLGVIVSRHEGRGLEASMLGIRRAISSSGADLTMQCTYKPSLCQEKNEKKGAYPEMARQISPQRPQRSQRRAHRHAWVGIEHRRSRLVDPRCLSTSVLGTLCASVVRSFSRVRVGRPARPQRPLP
jgi:hypothetical protein